MHLQMECRQQYFTEWFGSVSHLPITVFKLETTCHSACQYTGRLEPLSVNIMRGEKGLSYKLTEEEDGKTLYCYVF
jgi:hypothetical protein